MGKKPAVGVLAVATLLLGAAKPATADPVGPRVSSATETEPAPAREVEPGPGRPTAEAAATMVFEARAGSMAEVCKSFRNKTEFMSGANGQAFARLPHEAPRIIVESSVIGIAFFDHKSEPLAVSAAMPPGNSKLRVRLGGKEIVVDPGDPRYSRYFAPPRENVFCIPLGYTDDLRGELRSLRDDTPIVVEVVNGASTTARFARRKNAWDPYGLNLFYNGWVGMWFPVGLFASNLQTSGGSLEFSAMPIGVAVGARWWLDDEFYLGLSAVGNWSISSTGSEAGDGPMESDKVTKLDGVGVGGLVDVGSLFYVGGIYVLDIAGDDPGFMLTLGAGPGLIKLLTEMRQTAPGS
jgi:hypothetical protein